MGFSPSLSCWPQNWAMVLGQSELPSPQLRPVTQRKHTFLGEEWHTGHCLFPTDHGVFPNDRGVFSPKTVVCSLMTMLFSSMTVVCSVKIMVCSPLTVCIPWWQWWIPQMTMVCVFPHDRSVFPTTRGTHLQKRMEASHGISRKGAFLLLLSLLW